VALEEGAHSTWAKQFSHFVPQVCSTKRQEPIARRGCQSPTWAMGKGKSADSAVWAIRTALKESRQVWYCDHSRYLFNRAQATAGSAQGSNNLQDYFQLEATDSFNNMAGKQMVYMLKER